MQEMTKSNVILVSLTLVCCLGVVVHGFTYDDKEVLTEEGKLGMFERWRSHHKLESLSEKDKKLQYTNFKANLETVHNTNKANKPYKLEMNRFAGMTHAEFKSKHTGFKASPKKLKEEDPWYWPFRYENATVPPSIDWRALGAVGPVKNQEMCGSCYAFAATCTLEGMNVAIRKGELIELSPKELVDCGNLGGCDGGRMSDSFMYVSENGGLTTMKNYPYVPKVETCRLEKEKDIAIECHGYENVPFNKEKLLEKAVANQPVSVGIHVNEVFWLYKEGIMTEECSLHCIHAVVIVGYDTAPDGTKYWVIKNSWSADWGDKGYAKMLRGVDYKQGYCGIATDPSYPTFDHSSAPENKDEPVLHGGKEL